MTQGVIGKFFIMRDLHLKINEKERVRGAEKAVRIILRKFAG